MNILLIYFGKILSLLSRVLNLGHGSTWPGHIVLELNHNFIREVLKNSKTKIILIAGTNGKTSTGKLVRTILESQNKKVLHNESGANLLNGIASSLVINSNPLGTINHDFAIFEVDENTLPYATKELRPDFVVLLNLFRDQLDRYGEIDSIAKKWKITLEKLSKKTAIILNADDPLVSYLGKNLKNRVYFGLKSKDSGSIEPKHGADAIYCPKCNSKLTFSSIAYSHLGNWRCGNCGLLRPTPLVEETKYSSLPGIYNKYNTLAAITLCKILKIEDEKIQKAIKGFSPAFGRQEIVEYNGRKIKIFLSKNPTSFNESLRTIGKIDNLLIVLNDRIPDGRDVSWIWDVDFENLLKAKKVIVSGDRTFDMALRIKYAEFQISNTIIASQSKFQIEENLEKAIKRALSLASINEILYILPTYSAMLEVRKILTGRKIL